MSDIEAADRQNGEDSAVNAKNVVDEVKFTTELRKFYSGHDQNSKKSEWTEEKIKNVIKMIKDFNKAKFLGRRPTDKEYYHAKNYDIMTFSDEKVLIVKRKSQQDPVVQIVPNSQYYQRILDTHVATGHGRRDKIIYALKDKYIVPVFAINIFLQWCKTCLSKKSFPKTGVVVKPIISDNEGYGSQLICNLCTKEIKILRERKDSHLNLKRAAEKMTAHSSKKFNNIDVGATVLVDVPKVDRGPLD